MKQTMIERVFSAVEAEIWVENILKQKEENGPFKPPHLIYAAAEKECEGFIQYMSLQFEKNHILDFSCSRNKYIMITFDESSNYYNDNFIDTFNEIRRNACYSNEYRNIIGISIFNLHKVIENINSSQFAKFQKYFSNMCRHACVVFFYDPETNETDIADIEKTITQIKEMIQASCTDNNKGEKWTSKEQIEFLFPKESCATRGGVPIGDHRVVDNNEHVAIYGSTGTGKTTSIVMPMIANCIRKGESLIVIDSKAELTPVIRRELTNTSTQYQHFYIDLTNPYKSEDKWNPLSLISRLLRSEDPMDHDKGDALLNVMSNIIFPDDPKDYFWPESARCYFKGLVYALMERASTNEINIDSVAKMSEESEIITNDIAEIMNLKCNIASLFPEDPTSKIVLRDFVLKNFYKKSLKEEGIARRNLATYISAPNDTRGSIHGFADNGITKFGVSHGLINLLSQDTLNIADFCIDRPFVISIIIPDYSEATHAVAGFLVNQLVTHFIQTADSRRDKKMPIPVTCILEEIGSVGKKGLPDLPRWIATNRSRNIRFVLILQNYMQLVSCYGKEAAEVIKSNTRISACFSTPDMTTLSEWSKRCGNRIIRCAYGMEIREQLVNEQDLEAMPVGTALFLIDGYKFISHLEPYDCGEKDHIDSEITSAAVSCEYSKHKTFSIIKTLVEDLRREQLEDEDENDMYANVDFYFTQKEKLYEPLKKTDTAPNKEIVKDHLYSDDSAFGVSSHESFEDSGNNSNDPQEHADLMGSMRKGRMPLENANITSNKDSSVSDYLHKDDYVNNKSETESDSQKTNRNMHDKSAERCVEIIDNSSDYVMTVSTEDGSTKTVDPLIKFSFEYKGTEKEYLVYTWHEVVDIDCKEVYISIIDHYANYPVLANIRDEVEWELVSDYFSKILEEYINRHA